MLIQNQVWDLIREGVYRKNIISIAGAGSLGKTSLALYLVGNLLTFKQIQKSSCIWMQASEIFPRKRLKTLFSHDSGKLNYLNKNIFITPQTKACPNYCELLISFSKIIDLNFIPPPHLKFIVIDNISHHLRYHISKIMDVSNKITILNDFYNNYLLPIIFMCNREDIKLILIHEISANIDTGKMKPFFHKLYDRLDQFQITLFKDPNVKTMKLKLNNKTQVFSYHIIDSGFIWE